VDASIGNALVYLATSTVRSEKLVGFYRHDIIIHILNQNSFFLSFHPFATAAISHTNRKVQTNLSMILGLTEFPQVSP